MTKSKNQKTSPRKSTSSVRVGSGKDPQTEAELLKLGFAEGDIVTTTHEKVTGYRGTMTPKRASELSYHARLNHMVKEAGEVGLDFQFNTNPRSADTSGEDWVFVWVPPKGIYLNWSVDASEEEQRTIYLREFARANPERGGLRETYLRAVPLRCSEDFLKVWLAWFDQLCRAHGMRLHVSSAGNPYIAFESRASKAESAVLHCMDFMAAERLRAYNDKRHMDALRMRED